MSMVPSSSAMHGVTVSQNVTRAVAARIEVIERRARVWFGLAVVSVPASAFIAWALWSMATVDVALQACMYAAALPALTWFLSVVHGRARSKAARLDRARDVSWVTPRDGLVFFSDDVAFIERGVGLVAFGADHWQVEVADGRLVLTRNAQYAIEMSVPEGWTDEDTALIRDRVRRRRVSS